MPDDAAGAVRRTPRPAQLPRLAELAEQAGKLRTAEWLRTCALLPLEEWPPAPAYKGPMVPAAELDALQARVDAAHALTEPHPLRHWDTQWPIRAALEGVSAAEYAGEQDTRTASSGPTAQGIPAKSESTVERLDVSEVRRTWAPGMDPYVVAVERVPRAALQGDQPTEPRHELVLKSGLSGCTGACSCGTWHGGGRHEPPSRVAYRWDAEHLTSLPLGQPTGEADRG